METFELNNFKLNIIQSKKFKKTKISALFLRENKKEEIFLRSFLFEILTRTSKKYSTQRKLIIEQENNYNMGLNTSSKKIGKNILNFVSISFLNKQYTEENIDINALMFLKEIIMNPNINNGEFDKKTFDCIKEEFKSTILSIKNNPAGYAKIKSFIETDNNNPISYNIYNIEELEKITPKKLYEYYLDVIKKDEIEIFVIGDVKTDIYKEFFKSEFLIENNRLQYGNSIYEYDDFKKSKFIKVKDEKFKQSSLIMNYKIEKMTDFERKYVCKIFNVIFGGTADSKLFQNVREKNSLCYTINSSIFTDFSIMHIYAGIDYKNLEKTKKIIEEEFQNVKTKINDKELKNAKKLFISSLNSIFDSHDSILIYEFSKQRSMCDEISISKKNIEKVTKEDIYSFSKKIILDTVFVLYGGE